MGPVLLLGMMLGTLGLLVFGIFFLAGDATERRRWRPWLTRSVWLGLGCLALFVVASVGLR